MQLLDLVLYITMNFKTVLRTAFVTWTSCPCANKRSCILYVLACHNTLTCILRQYLAIQEFQYLHGHCKVGSGSLITKGQPCCAWLTQCSHHIFLISLSGDWHVAKPVSLGGNSLAGTMYNGTFGHTGGIVCGDVVT